jgi:hypothetical protein
MSEDFHKTTGPVLVGFLCALIVYANYFFSHPTLASTVTILRNTTILIAAFAMALGAINLIRVNYMYFSSKRQGLWMYAPIYIILFPLLGRLGVIRHPIYAYVTTNVNVPITTALNSFVSFFIVQGMYRALKVRNLESALITASTFLVMLRKIPLGGLIWPGFVPLGDWLLFVAGVGGIRALLIIFGFGVVSIGLRTVLGHERSHIGIIGEGEAE